MKIYIQDGTTDAYYYGYRSINIEQLSEQYYRFTPAKDDFSDVPFVKNISTITIAGSRCIMLSKDDCKIDVLAANPISSDLATWFRVDISTGHALACRRHLLDELGDMEAEIYISPISFNSGMIGIAINLDIDIISVSQSGMCDNYNEYHAPPFTELGILIVYAHYSNDHEELNHSTYIGDIVTVGAGEGFKGSNNNTSFGRGLEFYVDTQSKQSYAVPHVAGMFAKLKEHTGKTWNEIRRALRKTASFDAWQPDGGFGAVDYLKAFGDLKPGAVPRPKLIPKDRERI